MGMTVEIAEKMGEADKIGMKKGLVRGLFPAK